MDLRIGVGVGVFGFEMGEDVGIFFVAEPGVVVDAEVAVEEMLDRSASGDGRLRSGGGVDGD